MGYVYKELTVFTNKTHSGINDDCAQRFRCRPDPHTTTLCSDTPGNQDPQKYFDHARVERCMGPCSLKPVTIVFRMSLDLIKCHFLVFFQTSCAKPCRMRQTVAQEVFKRAFYAECPAADDKRTSAKGKPKRGHKLVL